MRIARIARRSHMPGIPVAGHIYVYIPFYCEHMHTHVRMLCTCVCLCAQQEGKLHVCTRTTHSCTYNMYTCSYMHMLICTHTPTVQIWLFNWGGKPLRSFLAVPHAQMSSFLISSRSLRLVKQLSKQMWWYFPFRSEVSVFAPSPCSVVLFFPVQTSNLKKQPLVLSAATHTLIPRLVGFSGMYCFSDDLPWKIEGVSVKRC